MKVRDVHALMYIYMYVCVCIYIYIHIHTNRTQLHVHHPRNEVRDERATVKLLPKTSHKMVLCMYRAQLHVHHPRVEVRDEHATVMLLQHGSAQDVAHFVPRLVLVEGLSGSGGSCFL